MALHLKEMELTDVQLFEAIKQTLDVLMKKSIKASDDIVELKRVIDQQHEEISRLNFITSLASISPSKCQLSSLYGS